MQFDPNKWRGCTVKEPFFMDGWNADWPNPCEELSRDLSECKSGPVLQPWNSFLGVLSKGSKYMHTKQSMHTYVYSSIICTSPALKAINRWMTNKEKVYIHTVKYYSAVKNKELISFTSFWPELEGIMLWFLYSFIALSTRERINTGWF